MRFNRPIRERDIERKVVAYCKKHGLVTYKFTSPSYAGVPDRIIMGGGRILFLELKAPGGKSTPLQCREQKRIKDAGLPVGVADTTEAALILIHDRVIHRPEKNFHVTLNTVVYTRKPDNTFVEEKSGSEFV